MRFFLLSYNVDTQVGLRLVGIDGVIIHERDPLIDYLEKLMQDPEICIILITTKLVELCPDIISELKLKQTSKLIVEIPDRRDSSKVGQPIDKYVSEAIGIKL